MKYPLCRKHAYPIIRTEPCVCDAPKMLNETFCVECTAKLPRTLRKLLKREWERFKKLTPQTQLAIRKGYKRSEWYKIHVQCLQYLGHDVQVMPVRDRYASKRTGRLNTAPLIAAFAMIANLDLKPLNLK